MKKWFQAYVDFEGELESLPMRFDPEEIKGFYKYTSHTTLVYTSFGKFKVREEYDKFCKRLFAFVNFDEIEKSNGSEEVVTTTKKRVVIKVREKQKIEDALTERMEYYDNHQPESNAGTYV
jgi:c-di-GMP-related signal transduction protein